MPGSVLLTGSGQGAGHQSESNRARHRPVCGLLRGPRGRGAQGAGRPAHALSSRGEEAASPHRLWGACPLPGRTPRFPISCPPGKSAGRTALLQPLGGWGIGGAPPGQPLCSDLARRGGRDLLKAACRCLSVSGAAHCPEPAGKPCYKTCVGSALREAEGVTRKLGSHLEVLRTAHEVALEERGRRPGHGAILQSPCGNWVPGSTTRCPLREDRGHRQVPERLSVLWSPRCGKRDGHSALSRRATHRSQILSRLLLSRQPVDNLGFLAAN